MATTTAFKVQCPSCEANVSIKSAALVGKKVDCPKCKYRFVVQNPSDLDDDDADGGTGQKSGKGGGTAVAKKSLAKSKAKKDDVDKPSKKKKKPNIILFVGIGLAVLTIGVLGAYVGGVFDGDEPASSGGGGGGGRAAAAAAEVRRRTTQLREPGNASPAKNDPAAPLPPGAPGIARDPTNLLPNDAQWVAHIEDVRAVLATPGGSAVFSPDKGTSGVVKECLGFDVKDIKQIVSCGGGDGSWTFTILRTQGAINQDALRAAMDLGDPVNNIRNRDYFLVKENPLFEAVGNYFATRLKELGFKIDPPAGPRQMTVCQLDGKTLAVADRQVMEKFLETNALPEYRSRLTTAPTSAPAGNSGFGPPGGMGIGGPPPVPGGGPTPSPLMPGAPRCSARDSSSAQHAALSVGERLIACTIPGSAPRARWARCNAANSRPARRTSGWSRTARNTCRFRTEGIHVHSDVPNRASQPEGDAQPHGFGREASGELRNSRANEPNARRVVRRRNRFRWWEIQAVAAARCEGARCDSEAAIPRHCPFQV